MKTLRDLRNYAESKGMSETKIERLISEVDTDENGNVINYDAICSGIDEEMEVVVGWYNEMNIKER